MRQSTYLNVILTVNAALLGAVVWTQVAGEPALVQSASAQSARDAGEGIPNAASQRQKMIEALREIKASVDSMQKALTSGKLKVEVSNLSEIKKVEVTNIEQLRSDRNK